MENLIVVIAFAILATFGVVWAINPDNAKNAAVRTIAFIVAIVLFAAMLAIPGIVRAEPIY